MGCRRPKRSGRAFGNQEVYTLLPHAKAGDLTFQERCPSRVAELNGRGVEKMKTSDSSDVIQGDEQCRDGHYCAKLDLRTKTVTSFGAAPIAELDPNDSTSLQAQNPMDLSKLRIGRASDGAAGLPAIWNTMLYGIGEMGPVRSSHAFLKIRPVRSWTFTVTLKGRCAKLHALRSFPMQLLVGALPHTIPRPMF